MLTKLAEQVSNIRVKSITDSPFKWGLLLLILSGIFQITHAEKWFVIVIVISGLTMFLVGIVFYCYHSIKNPDYLRSETFQLKKQSMEMIGDKDNIPNPHISMVVEICSPKIEDIDNNRSLDGFK